MNSNNNNLDNDKNNIILNENNSPLISIIMGSDSDLQVMSKCAKTLDSFDIPYELTIISAHRTPERMVSYAKMAETRGIKIIIAGAGGAAHLPGMVASLTNLPVIGVPIKTSSLSGVDSLYSIVQMPGGVPVATVAIDGAENAGLIAAKILALSDEIIRNKIDEHREELKRNVVKKAYELENIGYKKYLDKK